jgi:hypothetical protein
MAETVKSLKTMLNPEYLVQNSYLFGVLSIFLAMYGPRLHPKLPTPLKNLFENPLFRSVVLFMIVYLSSSNFQSAIVVTIIFLVTMNLLHTSKALESYVNIQNENFENFGAPVSKCSNYNNGSINTYGTPFYPLHAPESDDTSLGLNPTIDYTKTGKN